MFVRITTIQGSPQKTDAAVEFVETTGRPLLEASTGNRGIGVLVDDEAGRTLVASYWDTAAARLESESALAGRRGQAAAVAGGDVTVENYEVVVAQRLAMPPAGAPARLLRAQGEPGPETDELIAFYRSEALPLITGLAGLCSVQLLVDRESGRAISATAWADEAALAAAQDALAAAAAKFVERFGDRITGVEKYTVVSTTLQMS
ncbi:MAG: hypothetical protein ACT4RN_00575 [Pseudonocardia sp.]